MMRRHDKSSQKATTTTTAALDGTFGDSIRISFNPSNEEETFNNTIDFHALVVDVAGNIGFSDSDADGPAIHQQPG